MSTVTTPVASPPPVPLRPSPAPRAITGRSVALGLAGVVFVSAFTPFNDYALNNTFFVGNNLPLGLVGLTFLFALLVNGPLARFAPHRAFTSAELATAFSMGLVGCALPSSGLMRYLPPTMVTPFWQGGQNAAYLALLERMDLPRWLFPSFDGAGPRDWTNDPIVTGYFGRWIGPGAPPYLAWVRPALAWGVFVFAGYGAVLCMVAIVRRQWFENERLPFPLAQIQLALVEQPRPRRWLNETLARRSFWIPFAAVFFLRAWNGGHTYLPKYFAPIPLAFDFTEVFRDPPLAYVHYLTKRASVYFIAVGVTYFLATPVAFSLWAFIVLEQVYRMLLGGATGDPERGTAAWDEHLGGVVAFALAVLWIGRSHWKLVIAQMVRGARPGEPRGRYLPYPVAAWGLLGSAAVMCGWLIAAGVVAWAAPVLVLVLLTLVFVLTRIIAETGLVYGQMLVPLYRPWQLLWLAGWTNPVPLKTFWLSSLLQVNYYDFREPAGVYASHAARLSDATVFREAGMSGDGSSERRTGRRLVALLALSLAVAYLVSFASTLYVEYRFASQLDMAQNSSLNYWGAGMAQDIYVVAPTTHYDAGNIRTKHNAFGHIAGGFVLTGALAFLRLRYAWWPLHPIGFLMLPTTPTQVLWFSILLGWLAKVLILKFGGAGLYRRAKPAFLGLIVGDCAAAGAWLVTNVVLAMMGVPYRAVIIMPG